MTAMNEETVMLTIGYEGRTLAEFINILKVNGVDVVIDVRLTPISRKKGFSKTALRQALEESGIRYRHEKQFGNPKEFRVRANSIDECLALYDQNMKGRWHPLLRELIAEEEGERLCLLCVERHSGSCHRSVVTRHARRVFPGLPVQHL